MGKRYGSNYEMQLQKSVRMFKSKNYVMLNKIYKSHLRHALPRGGFCLVILG